MFAGAKVFTIVDMDKGYWQVVLHPDSRKYTCMAFGIGRYQFKRLPMGSKVASDIFQKMLDSVYIGLPGVTGIADVRSCLRKFHYRSQRRARAARSHPLDDQCKSAETGASQLN